MDDVLSAQDLLDAARRRISRFSPDEARAAQANGVVIVDLRCEADRVQEGAIPGAIPIALSVLPWRADPTSESHDDRIVDSELILVCNDGFSSSLAAADLLRMSIRAGDLVGGFRAWATAGLPVDPHP
ncbi:MAG: rhodanese-like domain-containing protein [Acidimicrobiia bacterium]|nr:rhodanese-like domain-containing protein [Acidimicrobiia bacterium]